MTILKDSTTKKIVRVFFMFLCPHLIRKMRQVGCFCYNAFTKDVLAAMIESHALVTKNKGVRRGGTFQQFAYGKMVPVGARVSQGDAPGDGYAPYAHMTSDTVEAIDALMAHGRVCSCFPHGISAILTEALGCRFVSHSYSAIHARYRARLSRNQHIK